MAARVPLDGASGASRAVGLMSREEGHNPMTWMDGWMVGGVGPRMKLPKHVTFVLKSRVR